MIVGFRDKGAAAVFQGKMSKGFPADVAPAARWKLAVLDAATQLDDLKVLPGNHLEALSGDRAGQHSIRINDQWWMCLVWREDSAHEVETVDYHRGRDPGG